MQKQQKIFLKHYEESAESLERYCLNLTRDKESAKELIAETVAIAWSNFNKIKEKKAFLSYLFTTARRIFFKNKYKPKEESDEFIDMISNDMNGEKQTEIRILYEALDKLNPDEKEAIVLFEIFGFKQKEIAKIQGIKENNVKVRIFRAKENLKKLLMVAST